MTNDQFSVKRCCDCNALFLVPFPSRKEIKRFYPQNYYSYDVNEPKGFFEKLKEKIIKSKMGGKSNLNFFDKFLLLVFQSKFSGLPLYKLENGKFLDIGCGNGKNLKLMAEYGWDTYGIELDGNAVANAKSQGLKVEQSSLEDADFHAIKFDSIRIWHVFEHLTEPQNAIKKLKELLSDNGEILMAVPNTRSIARKIFNKYWYGLDVPRHVIGYSPKTLKYLVHLHGLRITEIKYASCGSFLGSISNFLRQKFSYKGNLINNIFFVFMLSPIDFISDLFKVGDTIFLKIKKSELL